MACPSRDGGQRPLPASAHSRARAARWLWRVGEVGLLTCHAMTWELPGCGTGTRPSEWALQPELVVKHVQR